MTLLSVQHLHVEAAGRALLHDVSFEIAAGERVGLVGESGSGKSLTALAILQLLPAGFTTRGSIHLDGSVLTGMPESSLCQVRGAGISIVFQEPMTALNPLMSIGAQIAEAARVHLRLSRQAALARAGELLERVGLAAQGVSHARYPHELSGGQRQRVAIAMAVVLSPKLVIADEPTTALDARTQEDILDLLDRMVREQGSALLLISHDLPLVARRTDRALVMQAGTVVESGPSATVFQQALHPYTRSLAAASEHRPLRRASPGAAPDAVPLLSVEEVTCDYGRTRAVDGVSLTVMPGECVGLVGESGAGKSTLLRAILGVQPLTAGQVRIGGEVFSGARGGIRGGARDGPGDAALRRLRRKVQCVFQDPASSFDPRWPVHRLVSEPLHLLDAPPAPGATRERVVRLLERVGLAARDADRYPHEFSGGQRQRIAIARALIVEPALVVLDEAVSALDAATRTQILDLLAELSQALGIAYLFVSHDLNVIRVITDRVYVLQRGRTIGSGPTAHMLENLGPIPNHR